MLLTKRLIQGIATILVVTLFITFGLPIQYVQATKQTANPVNQFNEYDPSIGEATTALGQFTGQLNEYLVKINTSLEQQNLKQLKEDIKELEKAFKGLRKEVLKELEDNEIKMNKLNSSKGKKRQAEFKQEIDQRLTQYETFVTQLNDIAALMKELKGKDEIQLIEKVEQLRELLNPEPIHNPLGTNLPHNNITVDPISPTLGAGLTPAYQTVSVDAMESELPRIPTAEDKMVTRETILTPEIESLVDSMNTPVEIYEYVRNQINFEPYYGSRKGAIGTFQQKSGNDIDQASLLIAVLRYKEIPARYVRGTVEIPIAKVMGWTNAETEEAAVKTLGSLGIPVTSIIVGGKISMVRMEHTWVEAYVPYDNYRGVGSLTGQKVWIPLDPSYKQVEMKQGIDIEGITGLNSDSLLNPYTNKTLTDDMLGMTRVDTGEIESSIALATNKINQYITDHHLDNATLEDIFGGPAIVPQQLGLLPLSLPYKTITITEELRTIPDALTEFVSFGIRGSNPFGLNFAGEKDFEFKKSAPELYGQKITLSWQPASIEDETIINSYGGIFNTPAYLIEVVPQLKINGKVVAQGNPIGLGFKQEFTMKFSTPGMAEEIVTNPVTAGSFYNVSLDYGTIAVNELEQIKERLGKMSTTVSADNIYTDEAMGEILEAIGKSYFAQVDLLNKMTERQFNVKATRLLSEAMTGYEVSVSHLFMAPVEINEGSMFIDVDRNVFGVVNREGNHEQVKGFMLTSGILGSAMEHGIFEQMTDVPSVSTIKILNEANQRGIPIYNVTKENLSSVLPKLKVSQAVKNDITNAINAGRTVTIPQENIQYFGWSGTGYIVLDSTTGAAAYMISGGLAGGSMTFNQALEMFVKNYFQMIIGMIIWEIGLIVLPAGVITAATYILATMFAIHLINNIVTIITDEDQRVIVAQETLIELLSIVAFLPLGMLIHQEVAVLKTYIGDMISKNYPISAIINFVKTYGLGRITNAEMAITFFKNYGMLDESLTAVAKEFNASTIELIIQSLKESPIKFTSEDTSIILIFFKKVTTNSEGLILKQGIVSLAERGLVPANYAKYGIVSVLDTLATKVAIDSGIQLATMERLAEFEIHPSSYEELGITSQEAAEKATEAMTEAMNNAKFSRTALQSMSSFMDEMKSIIETNGMTIEKFNILRLESVELLTDSEKKSIKNIRESIPTPTNNTIMQKVIPQIDIIKYLDGTYKAVGGYITKAQDVKQLESYLDIYNSLRLDYTKSFYNPSIDDSLGVIRFMTPEASNIEIPYGPSMGGNVLDAPPFTGNGFTGALNGQVIPEYKSIKYLELYDGAELYLITKDGKEILLGIYDSSLGRFENIISRR